MTLNDFLNLLKDAKIKESNYDSTHLVYYDEKTGKMTSLNSILVDNKHDEPTIYLTSGKE